MKVYEIITNQVIAALEAGTIPWRRPWAVTEQKNLVSKREYSGMNAILLAMRDRSTPYWLTYKQCQELGGTVKKGEKAAQVVFYKRYAPEEEKDKPEKEQKLVWVLRYYNVFNLDQCEGLKAPEQGEPFNPIEKAEELVKGYANGPEIKHGSQQASYSPKQDVIAMPNKETFDSAEDYYATLFHEMTHSTGHESRLNRKDATVAIRFGSESYSKEELVAEMGAAFLTATAGIRNASVAGNEAAYIAGWISKLQNDKTLVIKAAGQAQKAVNYIKGVEVGVAA